MYYNTKSVSIKLEDADISKGIIKVMPSVFGNLDSDNEMIMRGAFKKTIEERGTTSPKNRIKHLWQHDTWQPIGKPLEMEETKKGLAVLTQFGSDDFSQDKFKQHIEEIITEMSIGFQVISSKRMDTGENEKEYAKLTELKLWEYSSVTWGSNYLTEAKNMQKAIGNAKEKIELIEKVNSRMTKLTKALRTGTYTDETFEMFEIELKQIQDFYNSLIQQPEQKSTVTEDKPSEIIKLFTKKINNS